MRLAAKSLTVWAVLLSLTPAVASVQSSNQNRVFCYTAYDADYFYIAAVVQKPELVGKQTVLFGDPRQDDAVGVYLQAEDNPAGAQRTNRSVEMVVSVAGGAQLYRGASSAPLKGFQDFRRTPDGSPAPFKFGVSRKGELNKPGEADNGYTVEMAIPWVEIGGPPKVGEKMRFNVVAYSAAPDSPSVLSLAPVVRSREEAQNPSLWAEIVFVDAPVRTVASAPQAKVSARVFTARPTVDGIVGEAEWHNLTAFGFAGGAGGGTVAVVPTIAAARVRPAVTLRKARPALMPARREARPLPSRSPQPLPRLVLGLYYYDFQADPRKGAPVMNVRREDSSSLLATHPMSGVGPWMTYDRLDWHREQAETMRRAGVDVIMPIYRAGVSDKQRYAQRGLITLAGALRYLANANRDYPLVGLWLDTTSLSGRQGDKPDLRTEEGRARLYAAIKDFFVNVPRRFRASIPLSDQNGGGTANLVVLSTASAFEGVDAAFTEDLRSRFMADFDADLLLLGGSDFKTRAALDGYVDDTHGRSFQMDESGWIKPASIGVGFDLTNVSGSSPSVGPVEQMRSRMEGEIYRAEWKQAITKGAAWVFLDGWNDYAQGAEIAPTMEHGVSYADITRAFSRAYAGTGAMRASFVSHTIPAVATERSVYAVTVRILNAGMVAWTPDQFALTYRWDRTGSGSEQNGRIPLPLAVLPGQALSIPLSLSMPSQPGNYSLVVDVAQLSKKGEVTALFSGLGSAPLRTPVQIVKTDDPGLPPYAVSLVDTDLPTTLEMGGSYTARVTLRNDGAQTWSKARGGRIAGRVWRYVSPLNSTAERESAEPMDMADASIELPADVPPGATVTVPVVVTFSTDDGTPLSPWSQSDNWVYQMRWEYSADDSGKEGAVTLPESFALVDADIGAQFTLDQTPRQLPGERRMPVKLGLRNRGPQTWKKDATRVGYHWYFLDGTEAVWQDETTPITQDIEPGGEIPEMLAWVTAPPNAGTYWLVWDVKVGDTWQSTLPGARSYETLVKQVEVVRGRTRMVDLRPFYNLDGVTSDADRADGDFDGRGRTLPAELIPPYALTDDAPATIWQPIIGAGLESSRRLSFLWGPKGDKAKNVVQCAGQRITLGDPRKAEVWSSVHLMAAATREGVTAGFTLIFDDGSQQYSSFPFSRWDAAPTLGEEVAFTCRYSHTRSGEATDRPVSLYRYTIRVKGGRKLAAILLPTAPDVKVTAITLEK